MAHISGKEFSQVGKSEMIKTTIQDLLPKVMKKMMVSITLGCCLVLFLLGLVCVTQAGIYWIHLIDHFCGGWGILIAAMLELVGIIWIYGGNRFIEDIEMMIGAKRWIFWLWWRACWFVITPILLIVQDLQVYLETLRGEDHLTHRLSNSKGSYNQSLG
ncbi:sodium- and chloride-dependent neutral and basic amino acid transporter B(0+)-like [Pongo abelii]|uniref:sodium- and chloride-dependent neutral and basic amino acid transporter B(0+)-like n=1 Tax=Pongo abelii TaxID=9601 RepID=UPI0023E8DAA6|nr:sodium- and chloride-dependent neutral and basic amino acid transporter B(0+)-like [Pongo abelii]